MENTPQPLTYPPHLLIDDLPPFANEGYAFDLSSMTCSTAGESGFYSVDSLEQLAERLIFLPSFTPPRS